MHVNLKFEKRNLLHAYTAVTPCFLFLFSLWICLSPNAPSDFFVKNFFVVACVFIGMILIRCYVAISLLNKAALIMQGLSERDYTNLLRELAFHAQTAFERQQRGQSIDHSEEDDLSAEVKLAKERFWKMHQIVRELTDVPMRERISDYYSPSHDRVS